MTRKKFSSDINLSKIVKNPVTTKANTLPSEKYVDQEDIKTIRAPKEFIDTSTLRDIAIKPSKIVPDF